MMMLGFLHLGLTPVPGRRLRGPSLAGGGTTLRPSPQAGHSVVSQMLQQPFHQLDIERLFWDCLVAWCPALQCSQLHILDYFFNSCGQLSRAWLEKEAQSLGFKHKEIFEHHKQGCLHLLLRGSNWGSTGGISSCGTPRLQRAATLGSALTTGCQQQSFPSAKWEHRSFGTKGWKCSWASWILLLLPIDGTCMKFASFQGALETNVSF